MNWRATISFLNALPICAIACLLDVQIVHEYSLRGLRAEVYHIGVVGSVAQLSAEHQVELAHLGPVLGARYRAYNLAVYDDLAESLKVIGIEGISHPLAHLVHLCLVAEDVRVGLHELGLIKGITELLACLLHLFLYLLLELGDIVLDKDIGTVALLGILVVDKRVIEGPHMSGSLPYLRVHENARVDTHYIFMEPHHGLPPVSLDVVLQLYSHLSVVIHGSEPVIDLA